jgi:arylsulfatase A-like enzyme
MVLIVAVGHVGLGGVRERRAVAALPAPGSGRPNVLIIILDTVRAATLSLYGSSLETTPALARWAGDGATFDWAFSPAPWTLPSHASMFTGRTAGELVANWTVPHDRTTPVLAEAFRDRGYRTAGFVGNLDYTSWDSGLDRGFAHYEDYHISFHQLWLSSSYTQTATIANALKARTVGEAIRSLLGGDLSINPKHRQHPRRADAVTNGFLQWHASSGDRPFFAFLNYFDAHAAYYSPPGSPVVGTPGTALSEYATAIRWLDSNLDSLFRTLKTRGALDNTVVIVTSDHGELFNEHGLWGHAHNLYRNVLHVPLVIRFPGQVPAGARVSRQVSLRHLAATVADLAGLPAGTFPGTSLRDTWEHPDAATSPVLAEVRRAPNVEANLPTATGDLAAVLDDSLHYIVSTAGREELFRYRTDSAEVADLAQGADRLTRLRERRDLLERVRGGTRQSARR